jgi:Zn-dependent peptidase ImmA (M78 family)/fido (protein-threonine AMPylation protein)
LSQFKDFNYDEYLKSPEILAEKVLNLYFNNIEPSFPLDPFKILKDFGVVIEPGEFKKLEGIYIAPENENDIAMVGINKKQPPTRQRFTAAHELCHHIKDRNIKDIYCPIGSGHPIERFANDFASSLLMPLKYLKIQVAKYEKKGLVSLNDIIYISDCFGVSFSSCAYTVAYRLKKLDGEIDCKVLAKRIKRFKPETKKLQLGLQRYDISLLRNMINAYSYIIINDNLASWYKFKNDFIYNENKIEGIKLTQEEISEIITDLRINKQESKYCSSEEKDIIEVLGHSEIYEYILKTDEAISGYSIKDLHKRLYSYSPFPELGGMTRKNNNFISGACTETLDYTLIDKEIYFLNKTIEEIIDRIEVFSLTDYIDEIVKLHHRLTVMHPFSDGNGRVSRAVLNWMFKYKKLPPVYIKLIAKDEYYKALESADQGDYNELYVVFYRAIINSLVQLNKSFCL